MLIEKKNVLERYNLPAKVEFCTKCVMSNQRPRISFNEDGVCSACQFAEHKRGFDWDRREQELHELCDLHRRSDGRFDVIVPCSGGKDGSFVAHQLKHKYGMNPLTVTWSPNIYTDIGFKNLRNFIDSGFSNVLGTANGEVNRKLMQLTFNHLGDPFQSFAYGQTNYPLQIAVQQNIPLIMYGENGEVEYGGDMVNAYKPTREITQHDKHYFSGLPVDFWTKYGLTKNDLAPYQAPDFDDIKQTGVEIHFMGYYHYWDPQENFYYCSEHTNFQANPTRSEGTYSKYASLDDQIDGFHYWLSYIKFGIGRATSDAAHEVRDGKIDREEAVALVRRFDSEFPKKYFQVFLDYIDITEDDFWAVADSWRSDHIWTKDGNDWKLKNSVWNV